MKPIGVGFLGCGRISTLHIRGYEGQRHAHVVAVCDRDANLARQRAAEWNVKVDPVSLQAVFSAAWDIAITPLDTCGRVRLDGPEFRRLYESGDPWMGILMENYRIWLPGAPYMDPDTDTTRVSSTLFDTVAVYLAATQELVSIEQLPLRVTDGGYTVIDRQNGRPVACATAWKSLSRYRRELVDTLLGGKIRSSAWPRTGRLF